MDHPTLRARGFRIMAYRWYACLVTFGPLSAYIITDLAVTWLCIAFIVSLLWQVLLFRPAIYIGHDEIRIQKVFRKIIVPTSEADRFVLERVKEANDFLTRSVYLSLIMRTETVPREIRIYWVSWLDFITAFSDGIERPKTRSQITVLNKLNNALRESQGVSSSDYE